ncbi:MAG: hypothetical protein GY851_22420, partial [bacterium]|nr:hypothetical protein [bacterium]
MRREVWISFGLILATFLVFAPTLANDFVNIDDGIYVTGNETVKSGLNATSIRKGLSPNIGHWHPLTWWSYMLDVQVFGVSSAGMHLTNLILHLVNTVLLFLLITRMTGAVWRSAVVAALFAIHPLHVEPVAWISSRKDVLSTLFLLLTIRSYAGYVAAPSRGRMARVALLYALGLMAKPALVALPLMLILLDFWPLDRIRSVAARDVWPLIREKLALFALSAASCFLTVYAAATWGAVGHETITFPLGTRISVAIVAYTAYLYQTIWPMHLAAYYPHPGAAFSMWQVGGAAILLILITAAALAVRRRAPYVLVGWLWF